MGWASVEIASFWSVRLYSLLLSFLEKSGKTLLFIRVGREGEEKRVIELNVVLV